jgi:hypothetical protein
MFRIGPVLNKAPFQDWEEEKLGNHWASIAGKLPGRTSCTVKSRWYSVLKNRQAQSNEANALDITNLLSRLVRTDLIGAWTRSQPLRQESCC